MDTDGRGWARPRLAVAQNQLDDPRNGTTMKVESEPSMKRCGGVDVGPYGLLHRRRRIAVDDGAGVDVPFFDNDTRPHSLVVPWNPGQPVLFNVQNADCHWMLFDYCTRIANKSKPHAYALRKWMNATVLPLLTPETGHWYPVLWGAAQAAQQFGTATADTTNDDYLDDLLPDVDITAVPNGNFYATIILVPTMVCWMMALCTTFIQTLVSIFFFIFRVYI